MIDRAIPLPKLSIPFRSTAIVMSLEVFQHDISLEHAALMETNNPKTRVRRRIRSREAAEKVVQKSDNQNKEFFQYVFHRDWDDPFKS